MTWARYIGTRVSFPLRVKAQQCVALLPDHTNPLIILKNVFLSANRAGSDMVQTRIHENDINSDDVNRISVDTDASEGLTSR
jgi:hypothetical protein